MLHTPNAGQKLLFQSCSCKYAEKATKIEEWNKTKHIFSSFPNAGQHRNTEQQWKVGLAPYKTGKNTSSEKF